MLSGLLLISEKTIPIGCVNRRNFRTRLTFAYNQNYKSSKLPPTELNIYFNLSVVTVVMVSAVTDIRYRRIPNRLVYPAITGAVFYHIWVQGLGGAIFSLTGLFGGIGLLIIPFLFRWMGAGDAKLLGFVGSAWGWPSVFEIFILAALSGGILAIGMIAANPRLLIRMLKKAGYLIANLFVGLKNFAVLSIGTGNFGAAIGPTGETSEDDALMKNRTRIPYGVAIAMGAVIWLVLNLSGHPLNFMAS